MSNFAKAALLLVLLLLPNAASAEFGFGPCCSGATCGIIPCDSTCAGPALERFGSTFSSMLNDVQSEHKTLSDKSIETTQNAVDFYTGLANQRTEDLNKNLSSLSGMTGKLMLAQDATIKVIQAQYETLTNSVVSAIKELSKLESYAAADSQLGSLAMPASLVAATENYKSSMTSLIERESQRRNLHNLITTTSNIKKDIVKKKLSKASRTDEVNFDLSLAMTLLRGRSSNADTSHISHMVWPFANEFQDGAKARAISHIVATNIEQAEIGGSLSRRLSEPALRGVADESVIGGTFKYNNSGLMRQITFNGQYTQALLSEMLELRRQRNAVLAGSNYENN